MFFSNHNINFEDNVIEVIENYVIKELNKIPIPDALYSILEDNLISKYLGDKLAKLLSIDKWFSFPFHQIPDIQGFLKDKIVVIGPMCMHMVITPHHIKLPELIYNKVLWYSPENKEKIQAIRSYYYSIIEHFSGSFALYATEQLWQKYFITNDFLGASTLYSFKEVLKSRYGTNKKSIYNFPHGKYPNYYIDTFNDIKAERK
jgi:hypothetical protein